MPRTRPARLLFLLAPLATACVQSVRRDGPSGTPIFGWPARVLEERPGNGRLIKPGDRIRVDMVGKYASGETWAEGPYTFIAGDGSYPGAMHPLRVGATIRMQYLVNPNDTSARLWPAPGGDPKNEAYLIRRDRGQIIVTHTIRSVCREYKIRFLSTGFGPLEAHLGCWPVVRPGGPQPSDRRAELERQVAEFESGVDNPAPDGKVVEIAPAPRARAEPSRYLGADGLRRAAREGRPEIVGYLLRNGGDVAEVDSLGFQAIHYVGWAQQPFERFVPAFENDFLAVVDTLLAHGADVNAPVGPGKSRGMSFPENEFLGRTAVSFAADECAERLVKHLLDRGATVKVEVESYGTVSLAAAAMKGCPETVRMLLNAGAAVDASPGGGTPLQRLCAASVFFQGLHFQTAKLLVDAGATTNVAAERLKSRLDDPGPGGFGFSNRAEAQRILDLLRSQKR